MRVNAINTQNMSFAKQGKFNRLEAKQRMRETERLVDKSMASLCTEFNDYNGIPFDKTIYYTSVSFNVPKSKNIATLAIEPPEENDVEGRGILIVEVEDENGEKAEAVPILVGSKDLINSYITDTVNAIPHLTRTVLQTSDELSEEQE